MFECSTCDDESWYQADCDEHMDDYRHWIEIIGSRPFRARRPMKFHSQQAAENHMTAKGHYKNYCQECRRSFMNENCLRQHLNSKTHRGTNIACPFCRTGFVTVSGVSHHLESGSCPQAKGLNRDRIHHIMKTTLFAQI
ncbi:Zinc finger C2H2 [Penicillium expansum]|nr:Zinc finger C2H2 [Penicillium expansum]